MFHSILSGSGLEPHQVRIPIPRFRKNMLSKAWVCLRRRLCLLEGDDERESAKWINEGGGSGWGSAGAEKLKVKPQNKASCKEWDWGGGADRQTEYRMRRALLSVTTPSASVLPAFRSLRAHTVSISTIMCHLNLKISTTYHRDASQEPWRIQISERVLS